MKFILTNCTRHYLRNRVMPFGNVGVVSLIRVVVWLVLLMVFTDCSVIADHFVSHFSKSCSSNDVTAASRLKRVYNDMRVGYSGAVVNESCQFDAGLVDDVIRRMKKGKAADLDGLTAEHLHFSNPILPSILAKFFNICISAGHVPVSFGKSYTCLLYTSPSPRD